MAFIGVEFLEVEGNNSVALVSSVWLTPRKKEVFWPPFKQAAQFERAIKNHIPADDSWKLYPISRCFFSCDEYEKARSKIKLAEVTSDINTDVEDLQPSQRKRSRPRRLSYGTSDDEEAITNLSHFERPPNVKPVKRVDAVKVNKYMHVARDTGGACPY